MMLAPSLLELLMLAPSVPELLMVTPGALRGPLLWKPPLEDLQRLSLCPVDLGL